MSDKQKFLDWIYRTSFESGSDFSEILLQGAKDALFMTGLDAEAFAQAEEQRFWNHLLQAVEEDQKRGIIPAFSIVHEPTKKLLWRASTLLRSDSVKERRIGALLRARPTLLQCVDDFSWRQYEALGCVTSFLAGGVRTKLTEPTGEGGIDFFALIEKPGRSHIFGGAQGRLRVVGQSKKWSERVGVEKIREFITTLEDVRRRTSKLANVVPPWFYAARGPIVGLLIAHSGFQGGAASLAKQHGLVFADSRDVIEIAALSRKLGCSLIDRRLEPVGYDPVDRKSGLRRCVNVELS